MRYFVFLLASIGVAAAQDSSIQVKQEQIEGPACAKPPVWQTRAAAAPCRDAELLEWTTDAEHWRAERRIRSGLAGEEYQRPELTWTQSSYVQPQMMVHDRFFYDPVARSYTVARYLDDLNKRYGGIDSVLVWHTYPNMGIDDRNQYDLFRDLPGGTTGIREFVAAFHERGVKVMFPIMLWDQGTRPAEMARRTRNCRGIARCRRRWHQRRYARWSATDFSESISGAGPSAGVAAGTGSSL